MLESKGMFAYIVHRETSKESARIWNHKWFSDVQVVGATQKCRFILDENKTQ